MGINIGGSVFLPAHPAMYVFTFLVSVFLAAVSLVAWRRTNHKVWLLFVVAFMIPVFASLAYVSYSAFYRMGLIRVPDRFVVLIATDGVLAHPERHSHLADVRSILDAGSSVLMTCFFLVASIGGLVKLKKINGAT